MTKSIYTLVRDIQGLFTGRNKAEFDDNDIDELGKAMAGHVKRRVEEVIDEQKPSTLRMSNLGTKCKRRLWYRVNDHKSAEDLKPSDRIKFLFGDLIEELALFLAKISGHEVRGRQDELVISGVRGRRDAVVDGVLVDVKSAASKSFEKFENHLTRDKDSFGYIDQLGAYHAASNDVDPDKAAFFVIDKQLGKITLDIHTKSDVNYEEEIESTKRILSHPNPPNRYYSDVPDGKSGNRKLCVECSYCEFKEKCWPNLRTYYYSGGPRYLTEVHREPKVESNVNSED